MMNNSKNVICVIVLVANIFSANSFVVPAKTFCHQNHVGGVSTDVTPSSSALNLNIPRLALPDVVEGAIEGLDLKNPNELDDDEYNGYAGAAIAGTLAFFLLPGLLISGLGEVAVQALTAVLQDFVLSALIGGGAAIYFSLRKDSIGDTVNGLGQSLLEKVDDVIGSSD